MQIIPAIDLLDSKCVRLVKGDFDQVTIYNNNPLDQIKLFEDHGIKKVHIVDLDAAKSGLSTSNTKLIKNIASSTNIEIQVGGGIRSIDKANEFYDIGVSKIIIGTAGIESAEFLTNLLTTFNSEFVIAGLDFNVKNKIPYLAINGWTKSTSINIYKEILDRFPDINLIGSGGVSCIKDINNLKQIGLNECVVGKAYYEGKIKMHEMIYVN
jgi:phosphoribosylformimino-5-aminoimidazole carboxamide ribotide isomerase